MSAQPHARILAEFQYSEDVWNPSNSSSTNKIAGQTNDFSFSIVCIVGTNDWEIFGNFDLNGNQKWHFDGTNLTQSLQMTGPPVFPEKMAARFPTNRFAFLLSTPADASSNLTINIFPSSDGLPRSDTRVNIPWLAFCSGNYLKKTNRIVPLPLTLIGHDPTTFGYLDETETFDDELGLPRSLKLSTSKSLHERSVSEFSKAIGKNNKPDTGIEDGLLKFQYNVTKSTNFLGWTFPLEFEFAENLPEPRGKLLRRRHGQGRIVDLTSSSEPKGVFDPRLRQMVVDWRFRSDFKALNAIVYRPTNNAVEPTNDHYLQSHFAAQLQRAPVAKAIREKRKRIALVSFFSLAVAIPIIGLLYKRRNLNQMKDNAAKP